MTALLGRAFGLTEQALGGKITPTVTAGISGGNRVRVSARSDPPGLTGMQAFPNVSALPPAAQAACFSTPVIGMRTHERSEREESGLVDVKELIKAGVHFGHRTSRWNPQMAPYILKKRNLIHIIDLRETMRGLITAVHLTKAVAAQGKYVLFVGTKRQARDIVTREAERCGMPYVCERWPGGLLTNYNTIRLRLERLVELEGLERTGEINHYSKKMVSSLRRERNKINRNLGGVRKMSGLPGLILIVDPQRERLAVNEGVKLNIPTIGWADTDSDPKVLDVCVPANDDAIASIQVFAATMADAVLSGRSKAEGGEPENVTEAVEEAGATEAIPDADRADVAEPVTESAETAPGTAQAQEQA